MNTYWSDMLEDLKKADQENSEHGGRCHVIRGTITLILSSDPRLVAFSSEEESFVSGLTKKYFLVEEVNRLFGSKIS